MIVPTLFFSFSKDENAQVKVVGRCHVVGPLRELFTTCSFVTANLKPAAIGTSESSGSF